MNLLNLDDATRVKIQKGVTVGLITTSVFQSVMLLRADKMIKELARKHNRNVRKMRVASEIIKKLVKEADPALLEEIVRTYEFDWIVADIDPDELQP